MKCTILIHHSADLWVMSRIYISHVSCTKVSCDMKFSKGSSLWSVLYWFTIVPTFESCLLYLSHVSCTICSNALLCGLMTDIWEFHITYYTFIFCYICISHYTWHITYCWLLRLFASPSSANRLLASSPTNATHANPAQQQHTTPPSPVEANNVFISR